MPKGVSECTPIFSVRHGVLAEAENPASRALSEDRQQHFASKAAVAVLVVWGVLIIFRVVTRSLGCKILQRRPGELRHKPSGVPMASFAYSHGVKSMEVALGDANYSGDMTM